MPPTQDKALDKSLKSLSIESTPVADSWEDEASDVSESEAPDQDSTTLESNSASNTTYTAPTSIDQRDEPASSSSPKASTKISPLQPQPLFLPGGNSVPSSTSPPSRPLDRNGSGEASARRPEKTNAVASRLIAGALGVKAPRRTEEQRAYDRAARETEKKRREQERNEIKMKGEAAERAKKDIWGD